MTLKNYLPITWTVLLVGLKNNWLTPKDISTIANANVRNLKCDEETLIDININDDDFEEMITILQKCKDIDEESALRIWQLSCLIDIKESKSSIGEKLKEIEYLWSRFNYPDSWRDFIYYQPNELTVTDEELYISFLTFIDEEERELNNLN